MTPEGKVKAKVNNALKEYGSLVWRFMPVQMGLGAPALDYLICVQGVFVAVETKVKGKKPTPRQYATIGAIREAGGIVFVVDDDESLQKMLTCIDRIIRRNRDDVADVLA